jgi:hypothetical protein
LNAPVEISADHIRRYTEDMSRDISEVGFETAVEMWESFSGFRISRHPTFLGIKGVIPFHFGR